VKRYVVFPIQLVPEPRDQALKGALEEALQTLVLWTEVPPQLHTIYHPQTHTMVAEDQTGYWALSEKYPRPGYVAKIDGPGRLAADC
jgi:hypothetical protein